MDVIFDFGEFGCRVWRGNSFSFIAGTINDVIHQVKPFIMDENSKQVYSVGINVSTGYGANAKRVFLLNNIDVIDIRIKSLSETLS